MEHMLFEFADRATVPCFIGQDVRDELVEHIREMQADKVLLVTEENVEKMYGDFFRSLTSVSSPAPGETLDEVEATVDVNKVVLPSGDEAKAWAHLSKLVHWNFEIGATKRSVVVAFGGGALLNVAGLFASICYRGMKLVYVPTTFLAMHDVVTSLKTSICFDGRKNNIGSFYAPQKILIDVAFCRTLPKSEVMSGLGELAKNACLFGGKHAEGFISALSKERIDSHNAGSGEELHLDDHILFKLTRLGVEAKMTMLKTDAYEKTSAMIFEYGHTMSHAIEKAYGDGVVPHGIGVTYGMLMCSYVAEKLGIMSAEDRIEHDQLCRLLTRRWPLPEPKPEAAVVFNRAMKDSKRGITSEAPDEISDVLLRKVGDVLPSKTNMLNKFPNKLVWEWLIDMGFPAPEKQAPQRDDCPPLLAKVGSAKNDQELEDLGLQPLQAGFANRVCSTILGSQEVIVKRYTDLVFLRIEPEAIGAVDTYAGERNVGPKVYFSNPQGLVEERIAGRTLNEKDMHKGDEALLDKVARSLASLHELPVPRACEGEPMLWRTVSKMMAVVSRKPELIPVGMPSVEELRAEVVVAKDALERRRPKVMLCHGDCKPSNVIFDDKTGTAQLIDFELGGPNYRSFDLMKMFRTAAGPSEKCMRRFFKAYLERMGEDAGEEQVTSLLAEAHMFEPLTWLEAAVFFLTLPQFKPSAGKWNELALDRWQKYCETKHHLFRA